MSQKRLSRREFIKSAAIGVGGLSIGVAAVNNLLLNPTGNLTVGFSGDAPQKLWKWSRSADWWEAKGRTVRCTLCPHECHLYEGDRGFCRNRVVKDGKLYTLTYENPCAVHVDPVEKKPLYHFLPGTKILSLATAGCNLRCLNCQNWDISQSKPEATENSEVTIESIVQYCSTKSLPSIAYTYSEPIAFFEYTKDTSIAARKRGLRNVLVTAGYINENPLRELCQVVDAANVDIKTFDEHTYKKLTGATLEPVLKALKVMKEENVWIEITRLIVPYYSDDLGDIKSMCQWIARELGRDTPLHFSRFHPAYKLQHVPPTSIALLEDSYHIAKAEGLDFVYIGNAATSLGRDTVCPKCLEKVIVREGFANLINGK